MSFGSIVGELAARKPSRPESYTRVQAGLHWLVVGLLVAQLSTAAQFQASGAE